MGSGTGPRSVLFGSEVRGLERSELKCLRSVEVGCMAGLVWIGSEDLDPEALYPGVVLQSLVSNCAEAAAGSEELGSDKPRLLRRTRPKDRGCLSLAVRGIRLEQQNPLSHPF